MRAIVFGGSGFLGSHVADALSERGMGVTVYDRRPSAYLRKGQRMIVGDVTDEAAVAAAVRGHGVVYNFAGYADIESAVHHPLDTVKANVLGNCVILEACRKAKVKRYVFASSLYVYSAAGSFYRDSKQACEAYIQSYARVYGLPYTILRFGSLYGPRSDERNGIHRLLSRALSGREIIYRGDGEEIREYIHVRDAALCSVDILDKAYKDRCLILTGSQSMKVKDFLTLLKEVLNGRLKVVFKPATGAPDDLHYKVTPYSFVPKEARKLVRTEYVDLGQGILSLITEMRGGGAR
jgi:UDP-glucose 4-epimerase